jgi:hypothetical protein
MSASNLTSVAFIYKRDYSNHKIVDITTRDHVLYAKIAKEDGFGGDSFLYPVRYANPQSVGGTFSAVRANARGSKGVQLRAFRTPKFGVVTIDGESALASKGNTKAWYDLITTETDSILIELGSSLAFDLYRDSSGKRGVISSISSNTITLTEPSDARNFMPGMTIIADDSAAGTSPRSGSTFVTAVDESAGTVTVDDVTDITGLTGGDTLFRQGDPGTCMEGLGVCTPLTAPVFGSDSFRGVDRGTDPNRLAGSRLNDTSLNAEVALQKLAVQISMVGRTHNVDEAYLHPNHFFHAATRLNAKVEYSNGGMSADYGFQNITLHTAAGAIKVYADPDCPLNRGYVTKSGSQYIKHLGGLPHIIDLDGMPMLRQNEENGIEARVESFCNLIQDDPSANGVCALATS